MIIKRVELVSFAGSAGLTADLSPGLNIVFGRNEAGKSTIFNAITHTLCTPSQLNKTRFRKEMERHLPAGGGDTVAVKISFSAAGGDYSLSKSWGSAASAELALPEKALVNGDDEVTARVTDLLPAPVSIVKSVLLTNQSGLERVLHDLKTGDNALFDLREVLRETLNGTEGINADKFRAGLEEEIASYYSRWDRVTGGPEQGRGYRNRWQKGCGKILTDYYDVEELSNIYKEIASAEDSLAEIAGELEGARAEYDKLSVFLAENEEAFSFAPLRVQKLRELEQATAAEAAHAAVYDEWPKAEARYLEIAEVLKEKRKSEQLLTAEREETRERDLKQARLQEIKSKLKTAGECTEKEKAARRRIETEGALPDEPYRDLMAMSNKIEEIERRLHTGSLFLTIKTKKKVDLNIKKGLEEPDKTAMEKGEEISFTAEVPVSIDYEDFFITASAGEVDVKKLESDYGGAKKRVDEALAAKSLGSMKEAAEKHDLYAALAGEVELAVRMRKTALAGETIADLEAELGAGETGKAARPLDEIQKDLTTIEHEIGALQVERTRLDERLQVLRKEYESRDAVLDRLVSARTSKNVLKEEIENGPGLPDGFDGWDSFLSVCGDSRLRRDRLSERLMKLTGERADLLGRMPADSAEETALRLKEAKAKFNNTMKTAAALERVLTKTDELLATSGVELSAGLKHEFETRLSAITGGKYDKSSFTDELPDGLVRKDGAALRYEQLSSGTKDGFSLALRLSVASYFLQGADGFVMMDDPLVDMDDFRRPAAAAALADFATDVQTIVFTCHEAHAALFTRCNMIRL